MNALLLLALVGCGQLSQSEPVFTGTIEVTEIEVAAAVPGRVVAVHVDEGDRVAAGDAVFAVDATMYEAQRDLTEAGVTMAGAAVDAAGAQVRAADAQVRLLKKESERVRALEDAGVGTDQQASTLEGQLEVARAQASAARQLVAQAEAAGGQAEAGLRAAEKQLAEADVAAVIGGIVLSRNREPGEVVAPGMSVVTIGDLDRPRLRVYVPLLRVEKLALGDTVQVVLDAMPDQPYTGRVQRIASKAEFTPRDILTPDERVKRVFAVEIALDPAPGLHPGMPAEAIFEGS